MGRTLSLALALLLLATGGARAEAPLKVVATFSILADFAQVVGGENVAVRTLVGPDGDSHSYEPSPSDSAALAAADVIVVNGLQFEPFADRMIAASGTRAMVITASEGISPLPAGEPDADAEEDEHHGHEGTHEGEDDHQDHAHGAFDPHAFQDPNLAAHYVANLARGFAAADPANAAAYDANAAIYSAKLVALDLKLRAAFGTLPTNRRILAVPHDAFAYFGRAYGLTFLSPQGISTEHGVSAGGVAQLIDVLRAQSVTAVFAENFGNPTLIEQIARETGAVVAGKLYSDALSLPDGPAPTYLAMMEANATTILDALQPPTR